MEVAMKTAMALVILLAAPAALWAQETETAVEDLKFDASADIKLKFIPFTNEHDLIKLDYTQYPGTPWFEFGLPAHFRFGGFLRNLKLEAYPYAWVSEENALSRVGLFIDLAYEMLPGNLEAGWFHHSWHNIDVDGPNLKGRAQDALFARWTILSSKTPDQDDLDFRLQLEPRIFLNNSEPIDIKTVYTGTEKAASWGIAMPVHLGWNVFELNLRPYVQLATDTTRYGASGELIYNCYSGFSIFIDFHWYTTDSSDADIYMMGVGILLKFR